MNKRISQFSRKIRTPASSRYKKQNKCSKLLDYFSKKQDLRVELVEQTYLQPVPTMQRLTAQEMAAVFALLCCESPVNDVLEIVERFSTDGWAEEFNETFFAAVESCSLDLKRSGFLEVSRDLIKIGEVTARMHTNPDWADRFHNMIEKGLSQQIRDQPFRKQPGW